MAGEHGRAIRTHRPDAYPAGRQPGTGSQLRPFGRAASRYERVRSAGRRYNGHSPLVRQRRGAAPAGTRTHDGDGDGDGTDAYWGDLRDFVPAVPSLRGPNEAHPATSAQEPTSTRTKTPLPTAQHRFDSTSIRSERTQCLLDGRLLDGPKSHHPSIRNEWASRGDRGRAMQLLTDVTMVVSPAIHPIQGPQRGRRLRAALGATD